MRERDWAKTPLGPVKSWPQNLKTCIRILLTSRQPMFVWWGDDLINLYNDAYKAIVGGKHPAALGQPASIVWREIWDQVSPRAESAMRANEGTYDEALLLVMERYGYREETYYTFSYSPIPNDQGGTGGIFCANSDDTQRIVAERQLAVLGDLGAKTGEAKSWQEACRRSASSLASNPWDLCFSLIYVVDDSRRQAVLAGLSGIDAGHPAAPAAIPLAPGGVWPIAEALASNEACIVHGVDSGFENLPKGAWDRPPHIGAVLPIAAGSGGRAGALVVGLNPYRVLDDQYSNFLKLVATQISSGIANAEAYEQERRRAESLAALDRAKTTFFSNVSHELRTPLTLMLGPLDDLLRSPLPSEERAQIELIQRNGLRLLKLVNTLLDFSRIEAGRVQAIYQPIDLCETTASIASSFRSAMEAAGLDFAVSCRPLSQPVFIDTEMWERVVLNLLSNALKFTMTGRIEVGVTEADGEACLTVRDTGMGIPTEELPRIFERFHRIEGTRGRTHEGTGIGLALVDELIRLHGGTVSVESKLGQGTVFTVRVPFGSAHLPPARITAKTASSRSAAGAVPYIQEALRWLPAAEPVEPVSSADPEHQDRASPGLANQDLTDLFEGEKSAAPLPARVMLIDDNRDMREYVQRLLARRYQVTAYENGEQALAAVSKNPPDLVLTDVMMPGLDGFQVVKRLRADPQTAAISIVMLSARAGEEARTEGMEEGADDYLIKPFTARELMARVGAHLAMHRLRSQLSARERELRMKAEKAEQRYRTIVESISEGFIVLDHSWAFRYINDPAAEIAGRAAADLIGKVVWDEFPGSKESVFGQAYLKAMESGEAQRVEAYYAPLDRWIRENIYPSSEGISVFVQDVSEKRRQEQKLLVSEKLAATGRLAATIAHEINNPLESVLNLLYLARISRSAPPEKIGEYLLTAEQELTRVSEIARHTLGFYRETSVPANIEIPRVLKDVLGVYRSRLNANRIEVVTRFEPVPPLHGLRGEMHQVFSNLVSNAIDAMQGGGRLLVSLSRAGRQGRPGVEVIVEDSGHGIPSSHRERLFEPFFTTKVSVGTGLGLWVVKQFVEEHHGTVTVESSVAEADHGTKFVIFLPFEAITSTISRAV